MYIMDSITSFLERFAHITPSNDLLREQCQQVIYEVSGVLIDKKYIHIRDHTVNLSCRSGQKNEIILYKETILTQLNTISSDRFFTTLL